MLKDGVMILLITILFATGLKAIGEVGASVAQVPSSPLSPDQSKAIQSIEQGNYGSVQFGQAGINTLDGFSGEISGSVSRSSDGISADRASVLRTSQGRITGASGIHASQNSLSFGSARSFKNGFVSARGVVNGRWVDNTFSADSVDFISANLPFFVSFDDANDVSFVFSGVLSSASLSFPSGKSFFINPSGYEFADGDGDGLSDKFEIDNGMNAHATDTDGDQLSDFDEVMVFPTDAKIADTYTADSLVDDLAFSFLIKRDPSVLGENLMDVAQDSDGDGISDVNEGRYDFDPENFDSDNDGFEDGFELVRGMNVLVGDESYCSGCFELSGEAGGEVSVDLSGYTGDMAGSRITYAVKKVRILFGVINMTISEPSESASVIFEKTMNGYKVSAVNEIGQTVTRDFSEKLFGSPLDFMMSPDDGVLTAVLPSPGLYRFEFNPKEEDYYGFLIDEERSFAQSFEIRRPDGQKPYSLFIDKGRQSFEEYKSTATEDSGFVSLREHVLQLRGVVTYARQKFEIGKNVWRAGTKSFVEHIRTDSFVPVIESFHPLNVFTLLLDRTNVFVNAIASLPIPVEKNLLYFAHFDDLGIYEVAEGGSTTLLRRWENSTPALQRFETNTQKSHFDVSDGIVRVVENDTPVQFFVSAQDSQQVLFNSLMDKYRIRQCDSYFSFEKLGFGGLLR